MYVNQDKAIAAIATGAGGAIGIVRISGIDAIEITSRVFVGKKDLNQMRGFTGTLGMVYEHKGKSKAYIDEAIVNVYRTPNSYTGEDICEISCHGGLYGMERILTALIAAGATLAQPGEFTKRAYLNGKMTLTEAESVAQLVSSQNAQCTKTALDHKKGKLNQYITAVTSNIADIEAHIAAWADFPEEDVEEVITSKLEAVLSEEINQLGKVVMQYDKGEIIREGVTTAIVGCPNVGKSTLMNWFVGYERSIVTDQVGTTRDIIQEQVRLTRITLNLSDTAGIHNTFDQVERIGVGRSVSRIHSSQLILAVFDASRPLNESDKSLLDRLNGKLALGVLNKCDKVDGVLLQDVKNEVLKHCCMAVEVSALSRVGMDELEKAVEEMVCLNHLDPNTVLLSNKRQLNAAIKALKIMQDALRELHVGQTLDAVSMLLHEILESLMEITGKNATEEVINKVFENFCVGK